MAFHELLLRQLKRSALDAAELPTELSQWNAFLNHVNASYHEFDQSRYTLERSQEIVSREMQELVDSLHQAEEIGRLGSWNRNFEKNIIQWSPETYRLFGRDPALGPPSFDEFYEYLHPDDREKHKNLFANARNEGIPFVDEIRIKSGDDFVWLLTNGQAYRNPNTNAIIGVRGTCLDINKVKQAEIYTKSLHKQLVHEARKAGMADVATSVLHNIGNVLNSVNVICTFLIDTLANSQFSNLSRVLTLLEQNKAKLGSFFIEHPQGKHVLEFIKLLADGWESDQKLMMGELKALGEHIQHIKNIVMTQQSYGGYLGVTESVNISGLLEDAIVITSPGQANKEEIKFIRKYDFNEPIVIDKMKVSQLLVNIIKNARESIIESNLPQKEITIATSKNENFLVISISDTGLGIDKKNLTSMFAYGFTTKKEGHGFGLHISALSAKEMGGSLRAESEGLGKGATFILKLPLNAPKAQKMAQSGSVH